MRAVFVRVVLGLVCVAGCEASVCEGLVCFDEGRRTSWGMAPGPMRWVDVDSDGAADLVAASPGQGTVSVLWGADATFGATATTWSVASVVAGLSVADVDGDGLVDLVTAVPEEDEVAVLRGRGGRTFAGAVRMAAGAEPRAVIAAQLDGEGVMELVTVNAGDGTVSVLRDGTVTSTVVGPGPRDVAAGDLDGDGDVDLAVALAERAAVQVLLGDGSGGLSVGELFAVGAAPHAVAIADFDGNGALDLASADTLANTVSVVLGEGAGGGRERREWAVDPEPRGLAVVEREGEAPGLAVLSSGTRSVTVLEPVSGERIAGTTIGAVMGIAAGDVDGVPGAEVIYADASRVGTLQPGVGVIVEPLWKGGLGGVEAFAADVDGDGIDEVVVGHMVGEELGYLSTSTATLEVMWAGAAGEELELHLSGRVSAVEAADFTGDGLRDVFVASAYEAVVVVQQADGALIVGESFALSGATGWAIADGGDRSVVLIGQEGGLSELRADDAGTLKRVLQLDLQGTPVWMSWVDGRLVYATPRDLWAWNGSGVDERIFHAEADVQDVAIGDFAGDGAADAVLCSLGELVYVADFYEDEREALRIGDVACEEVVTSDLNGDGALDVLVRNRDYRIVVVTPWLMRSGVWSAEASRTVPVEGWGRFARLDEDGVVDVVMNGPRQQVTGWRVGFGPALREEQLRQFGAGKAEIGDVNGDGAPDVVMFGEYLAVGFGDGDAGFEPFVQTSREEWLLESKRVRDAVMVDLEGDGRMEVVVAVEGTEDPRTSVRVVRIDDAGAMVAEEVTAFWWRGVQLSAGEFDGDGVVDVVALSEELGLVWLSGASGLRGGEFVLATLSGISAMDAGDVDGDGNLDVFASTDEGLVVFRGLGGGEFAAKQVWWAGTDGGDWTFGDVDLDGRMDAVLANGELLLWREGGPVELLRWTWMTELVDLDGDGQLELLAAGRNYAANGAVMLHVGRSGGAGQFVFTEQVVATTEPQEMVVADFDGDERVDVALVDPASGVTILRRLP